MNCIIVDDELDGRKSLKGFLDLFCPEVNVVDTADSKESALRVLSETKVDLVFLDIELGDSNAFDLLKDIDEINFAIIFVTAYDHYSLKAIKLSAVDYLLKPVDPEELADAVKKARMSIQQKNVTERIEMLRQNTSNLEKIALPTMQGFVFAKIDEILRCEADNTYTEITFTNKDKTLVVSKPIKEFEEILGSKGFIRIHKSHMININKIDNYKQGDGGYVVMENGESIPVARSRKEQFLKAIK